jgi:hypothetical protein
MLAAIGIKRISVMSPIKAQERPTLERWIAAGFETTVFTARLEDLSLIRQHCVYSQCLVLDFVGHTPLKLKYLQASLDIPVVDLGMLTIATMAQTLHS